MDRAEISQETTPLHYSKELFKSPGFTIESKYGDDYKMVTKPKRNLQAYEIVWLENSKGTCCLDFELHPYEGDVLFLIPPRQVYCVKADYYESMHNIIFEDDFFGTGMLPLQRSEAEVFGYVSRDPVIEMPEEARHQMVYLVQRLKEEMESGYDHRGIMAAYLHELLKKIAAIKKKNFEAEEKAGHERLSTFRNFTKLLERQYLEKHEVQHYADLLLIHPRKLNETIKYFTGITASQFIKERLVLEAKRLLFSSMLSVKEIAFELGFEDPSYFTRFFRKNTGIAPLEFRESQIHKFL